MNRVGHLLHMPVRELRIDRQHEGPPVDRLRVRAGTDPIAVISIHLVEIVGQIGVLGRYFPSG